MKHDTPRVLVVEDDEDDLFMTERSLRRFISGPIFHVDNGRDAIDYLAGSGIYADRTRFPLPDVMFLDLKMNQMTGHEVLQWIGSAPLPHRPRIFVLTGSNEFRDRERVKNSGVAAGYIVKPLSAEHLATIFNAEASQATGAPPPVSGEAPAR